MGLFAASRDQGGQGHGEGTAHTDDGTAGRQDRDRGPRALPVGESVDVVVSQASASDHHHLYFRTPEGGERVIQTRYRSTASAMRKAKQVGGQLHFNRVLRDDFTVHIEPCPDSWSECHLWSGLG